MLSFVSIHIGTGIFKAQARGKKKKKQTLVVCVSDWSFLAEKKPKLSQTSLYKSASRRFHWDSWFGQPIYYPFSKLYPAL